MRFVLFALVLAIICTRAVWPQTPKLQYVIGGSTTDLANVFMGKFRPLFEDYLNEAVGSKFSPNISFKLITVDYTPSTRAQNLVASGAVDFVCMLQCYCHFLFLLLIQF